MEQRSLRVVETNKTFFNKITNTLSKLLVPTRLGLNSMMISIKRNSLLKAYVSYMGAQDEAKKELAAKKYHAYYINGIIYNYTRIVDFNSLPILNPTSNAIEYTWRKELRKKIDSKYKLIVVMDSVLLNEKT